MTTASNQAHLDQDVQGIAAAFAQVVAELKAQAATGQPVNFTAADALVASVQGEATADAPAAPPAGTTPPPPAPGTVPAPGTDPGTGLPPTGLPPTPAPGL